MPADVWMRMRAMLARYVEVPEEDFEMGKSLDLHYDMDSTELTEIAKTIEAEFSLSIDKSTRSAWETGADIAAFVSEHGNGRQAPAAADGAARPA
jgi:acyl carrier protein